MPDTQSLAPPRDSNHATRVQLLRVLFGLLLQVRFLYPLFNSPLEHLFSDPQRHWENATRFLHPSIMGSDDPYLYQLWLYLLQRLAAGSSTALLLGCGLLCALMPYGWYRALRELMPAPAALVGGIMMALVPDFLGIYAYFMNETLLLALTGVAFWLTFRARRKDGIGAFALASAAWLAASFTRPAVLPLAAVSLLYVWLPSRHRALKLLACLAVFLIIATPAGLHARAKLGFFAPFGNLYLHEIYRESGNRRIELDFGPDGRYWFVSPSFANPTFYPISDWLTQRQGTVDVAIDLKHGREDWIRERARVERTRSISALADTGENLLFLAFGQSWPNNDRESLSGWLATWARWVWVPVILLVAYALGRGAFRGAERLLPISALAVFLWLGFQQDGIVEGRFRLPLEPVFLAAAFVAVRRWVTRARRAS